MRRQSLWFVALCTCAAAGLALPRSAHAQRSVERPLRWIVPFPPGSAPDTVARIMGPQITAALGQPVVIDSRLGAAGTLATDLGAKALPDGHTITFAVLGPVALAPSLY